ncbi:5-formyltetrahydrofolate cyclo-ligase [Paenibacillus sp. strain BS8-2]
MDSQEAAQNKSELRAHYTERRNAIDAENRLAWSREASRYVAELAESQQMKSIMAYVAFRSELDLGELIRSCWQCGIDIIVPRCTFADRGMTLHQINSFDQLRSGAYGIMEPDPSLAPQLEDTWVPELILVPGLAFDKKGGRMGYGGGYYDRYWERLESLGNNENKRPIWLGVSFESQIQEYVPCEAHDLVLDGVVTERGVHWRVPAD